MEPGHLPAGVAARCTRQPGGCNPDSSRQP
jgi:hypothetical protein